MTSVLCSTQGHAEFVANFRNQTQDTQWVAVYLPEHDLPDLGREGWAVVPVHVWREAFNNRQWNPAPLTTPATVVLSAILMLALLLFGAISGCGAEISDAFLLAVEQVESGGRTQAQGDGGKALGSFQFWRGTWGHVSTLRAKRGLRVAGYHCATNRAWAFAYARSYFQWINSYLTTAGLPNPTPAQLYAAWNLGPRGFRRRGFLLSRCPRITQRAAGKVANLTRAWGARHEFAVQ